MAHGGTPQFTQVSFRGREDDGVENLDQVDGGATNIDGINVNFSRIADETFRLRFLLSYNGNLGNQSEDMNLAVSHNGGSYSNISTSSSFLQNATSDFLTTGDDCTEYDGSLFSGTHFATNNNGQCESPDSKTGVCSYLSPFPVEAELEWAVVIVGDDVSDGDTLDIQVWKDVEEIFAYANIPRITVQVPVIILKSFEVTASDDTLIVTEDEDPSVVVVDSDLINVMAFNPQLDPSVIDRKALDFAANETLLNSSDNPIGIANEWSIQINTEPGSDTINMYLMRLQQISGSNNQIAIHLRGDLANDPIRIQILRSTGFSLKDYEWNDTYTLGTKVSYIFTWDGTDLLLYVDGVDQSDADTKTSDFSNTMTATDRRVSIGSSMTGVPYTGLIHSTSIWNVKLTQSEITALQKRGSPQDFDNRFNSGNYLNAASLQHYWRHGFNALDIGEDLGYATTLIDVGNNSVNISADDIVTY